MASRGAIAAMSDIAFKRLFVAMADINTAFPDVEPAVLQSFRDIRYQEAARYDALASWAERLAVAMGVSSVPEVVEPEPDVEDTNEPEVAGSETIAYADMSNNKLRKLAKQRGISLHDRDEIIDALQAADGFTEDEQAQMDAMGDDGAAS